MKQVRSRVIAGIFLLAAVLTPIAMFTVGNLISQSDAVIIAGNDDSGNGGG